MLGSELHWVFLGFKHRARLGSKWRFVDQQSSKNFYAPVPPVRSVHCRNLSAGTCNSAYSASSGCGSKVPQRQSRAKHLPDQGTCMALQQVFDAPQQLQDIFDTSDSLWEAERALQVVLERVGRHVERQVVSETENKDAIQSCLAIILAAADHASGEESPFDAPQVSQSRPEENAVPQLPRFTRGGIPIRAETSPQEGGLMAYEWTIIMLLQ